MYLKLQPYRQLSVGAKRNLKFSPKFYGPFLIVRKVGTVAYKLQLSNEARIHNVLLISLLKKKVGSDQLVQHSLPDLSNNDSGAVLPLAVLATRAVCRDGHSIQQVLIQWGSLSVDDAT